MDPSHGVAIDLSPGRRRCALARPRLASGVAESPGRDVGLAESGWSGTLGEYGRLPRSEGAAESSDAEGIGVPSHLDCSNDLFLPRVSLLPLFQSGADINMYTQGSAPPWAKFSRAFGAENADAGSRVESAAK
jgi:hypothetical protein